MGHAYSAETLLAEQSDDIEAALWAALRSLEERAALTRHLAARVQCGQRQFALAERFEARAGEAQERAELIRKALLSSSTDERGGREYPISPEGVA